MNTDSIKLTSFSHGGGCGCKVAPGILAEILKNSSGFPIPEKLLVGIETADDAAVYKLNDEQALIATTDFSLHSPARPTLMHHCRSATTRRFHNRTSSRA